MVFLGDIVDRGKRQLMGLVLIVAGLVLHPDTICYVSGNHELASCHRQYGFLHQLKDEGYPDYLYDAIIGFMAALPLVAIIDERIMAMHGGLGPEVTAEVIRDGFDPRDAMSYKLKTGILWSDPNHGVKRFSENLSRGAGYYFGIEAIADVRHRLGIDFIIRAHQEMNTGVRFFGDWLISVYTTCRRGPCIALKGATDADQRMEIIAEDMEENAEMGGVLVYDGSRSLTMIHFIPAYQFFDSHEQFAAAFDDKLANELAFAHANCDATFEPFRFDTKDTTAASAASQNAEDSEVTVA
ncbi:unnamed protein product, partial [Mesorhabditis spiculigera]